MAERRATPLDFVDAIPLDDAERLIRDELLRRDISKRHVEPFAKYFDDPCKFARDELRMRLWSRQEEILASLVEHTITLVLSGQKCGKTTIFAVATYFWLATRWLGNVVMTTGSGNQLRGQLWAEIKAVDMRSGIVERLGATLNDDPETGLRMPDGRFAIGIQPKDQVRMAGYSGAQQLVIIDECTAFPDAMWEPVRGNLLGGGHALVGGNATKNSGFAFEYFTTKKGEANAIRVSSKETPNYVEGRMVLPGLATREDVEKLIREYGDDHPVVQVRVYGRHAKFSEKGVIGLGDLEEAVKRWSPKLWAEANAKGEARLAIGVDVARFGADDSVMQPVRGDVAGPSTIVHGMDTVDVAGKTLQLARALRHTDLRGIVEKPLVIVDTAGVGGGVADILKRKPDEVEVLEADSATNANAKDEHHRFRDEMWWLARKWMPTAALPPDAQRDQELLACDYRFDERMRTLVDDKETIKKKLTPQRSPDRADALCLALSRPKRVQVRSFHIRGL